MNILAYLPFGKQNEIQFIEGTDFSVSYKNRAFQYGDGLFETIFVKNSKIQYLKLHLKRLSNGLSTLGFIGFEKIEFGWIEKTIFDLLNRNKISESARVKISVWRAEGGLYTPQNQGFELLISVSEHQIQTKPNYIETDFCQTVKNNYSAFSAYKTLSSMPYTMAGLERKSRDLDDVILLSNSGYISECLASNIFWKRNGIFYTPSVKSGCVAGIRREIITKFLRKEGFFVRRKLAKKSELLKADYAFNANVASIQIISKIGKMNFPKDFEMESLVEKMIGK